MSEGDASSSAMIGIGVTGHRRARIGTARLDHVRAQIDSVLAAIAAASGGAPLRLVSSLADGTDGIAADAARAQGWAVDAVLPFARDDYATDHDEAEREPYATQLAAARRVFEIPARRSSNGDGAAYERAGRIVLSQSDLLIAVWDGGPARGRGGAPQIVAEAVVANIPVVLIDPSKDVPPVVLWDGLIEHDLGQQTVETVARASLDALPAVFGTLAPSAVAPPPAPRVGRGIAFPLLLAVFGVRRPRRADFTRPDPAQAHAVVGTLCGGEGARDFGRDLAATLSPAFAEADTEATATARAFRSSWVANFTLAALAVVLSMAGLVIAHGARPFVAIAELATIATILTLTRRGNRARLHERWLDNRDLAERLRCLALGAQLGELDLRAPAGTSAAWVTATARDIARRIGLPSVVADDAYLGCVRTGLRGLLEDQIAYLHAEAARMHRLDHRLHLLGTCAFVTTALVCITVFGIEWLGQLHMMDTHAVPPALFLGATILSAALPAIGAAIYGIRMQGDFAGIAERNEALAHQLAALRTVDAADALSFDTLRRRIARATDLLTADRTHWRQTYHARPLALPG